MKRRMRHLFEAAIIDLFAGLGGASMGIEQGLNEVGGQFAGRTVDVAINHDRVMLACHMANHPCTTHLKTDVWDIDPATVMPGVNLLWVHLSPDCTDFSNAKRGVPKRKSIRSLAWVGIRWAEKRRPLIISLENVREFEDWGPLIPMLDDQGRPKLCPKTGEQLMTPDPARRGQTFKRFVAKLRKLGYHVDWRVLDAADYTGADRPMPTVSGKHGFGVVQATYVAQSGYGERPGQAARCNPVDQPIGTNVAGGVKHAIINVQAAVVGKHYGGMVGHAPDETLGTITGTDHHSVNTASVARICHNGGNGAKVASIADPLGTITSKNEHLVESVEVAGFTLGAGGPVYGGKPRPVDEPLGTVMKDDRRAAGSVFIIQMNHGEKQWRSVADPASTITSQGNKLGLSFCRYATVYYGGDTCHQDLNRPLRTATANDRFGICEATAASVVLTPEQLDRALMISMWLVKYVGLEKAAPHLGEVHIDGKFVGYVVVAQLDEAGACGVIVDVGMRMFQPRELARCQGFPDSYVLPTKRDGTINKSQATRGIGNSVPPGFMRNIVKVNLAPLVAEERRRRRRKAVSA